MSCLYGPSRQTGKPRRKRLAPGQDATTEKRVCTVWNESGNIHTHMAIGSAQSVSDTPHENFTNTAASMVPFSSTVNSPSGVNGYTQLPSDLYPCLPLEEWPQFGEWDQFDNFETGPDIPPISPLAPPDSTARSSDESHSCARESYEIFRDLICPAPSLHAPESNSVTVSAQLDQVLQFNRDAMDRLTRVLKCHCATSGHRAMVHASIVSRILIWYQQAAGSSSGSTISSLLSSCSLPLPPSMAATDEGTTSIPSLAQVTGFSVEHVPVSVGTFSIGDEKMQAVFRSQLVLSEVKKMTVLIDMFTSKDLGESSPSGVAGLYAHLGSWLRSEHSKTVGMLKFELSALKKDLES